MILCSFKCESTNTQACLRFRLITCHFGVTFWTSEGTMGWECQHCICLVGKTRTFNWIEVDKYSSFILDFSLHSALLMTEFMIYAISLCREMGFPCRQMIRNDSFEICTGDSADGYLSNLIITQHSEKNIFSQVPKKYLLLSCLVCRKLDSQFFLTLFKWCCRKRTWRSTQKPLTLQNETPTKLLKTLKLAEFLTKLILV